jgi:xanthine dehydrogenase accessory factor
VHDDFSIIPENVEISVEEIKASSVDLFRKDKVRIITKENMNIILEPVRGIYTLVVFGGGHVSKYLTDMAGICDFSVVIVDDREEFASKQRFPAADKVICEDFEKSLTGLHITNKTFIVIVTRGHSSDEIVLKQALNSDAGYIGMIGSKKKVRTLYQNLIGKGFHQEDFERIFAPIGIDIGARTAETIAVSILAELIKIREYHDDRPISHLKENMAFYFNKK